MRTVNRVLTALMMLSLCTTSARSTAAGDGCTQYRTVGVPVQLTFDLADDIEPCWSPDGTKIAFASNRLGNQEIRIVDLTTGADDSVTSNGNTNWHPDWSPDGQLISYTGGPGSDQIWVVAPDGSGDTPVTTTGPHRHPDWSPDGTEFVYTARIGVEGPILIINSDGSGTPSTVVSSGWYANWSPNGNRIAFARYAGGGQIYLVDPDGSNLKNISTSGEYHAWPAWSPDGSMIACTITRSGHGGVYVIDTLGNELLQVTSIPTSDHSSPTWSPTGDALAFQSNQSGNVDIWKVGIECEQPVLSFPITSDLPCDSCELGYIEQPVACQLHIPANGATVSVAIPDSVEVCGISFEGLLTETWDYKDAVIDNESGHIVVYMASSFGEVIPPDTTVTLFNIEFSAPPQCKESYFIHWDTALSADPGRMTKFSDTLSQTFTPVLNPTSDSTEILGYMPGDLDNSGLVDIGDLTMLITKMFITLDSYCNVDAADVNGDCVGPDIGDITWLIRSLFIVVDPKLLQCGCIRAGAAQAPKAVSSRFSVEADYREGETVIRLNSPIFLYGLQLELAGPEGATPVLSAAVDLNLVFGEKDGSLRIGVFDLEGANMLSAGKQDVLRLQGEYDIVSAVVSDSEHRSIAVALNGVSGSGTLPHKFALHQNYPNPFNPTTSIAFALPEVSQVTLHIYNINGQKIATLVDGFLDAGEHSVQWNASGAASGVYLYRITAGEFVQTRKMVLLK